MSINPLSPSTLALGVVATVIFFALFAFFTRASLRRSAAALIGAIPIIPWVMGVDAVAARQGWWHYPSVTTGSAPVAWYIAAALFYGAGLGLVGWRVIRRFGKRGVAPFLIVMALFGVARDYSYSFSTQFIEFGHGWIPFIADFFSYALAATIEQLVMLWVAGSPCSDSLAREAIIK